MKIGRKFLCVFFILLMATPFFSVSARELSVPVWERYAENPNATTPFFFVSAREISVHDLERYAESLNAFGEHISYVEYLEQHSDAPRSCPDDTTYIFPVQPMLNHEITTYYGGRSGERVSTTVSRLNDRYLRDFEGVDRISVFTDEQDFIEWKVTVQEAGLYNISVLYYNIEGRSSAIQRAIFINGELPFAEAATVEFPRTWVNASDEIVRDNQGNDRRPAQIEQHRWSEVVIRDNMGSFNEPLLFYLEEGTNTIGFFSQREPMIVKHIKIFRVPQVKTYAEVFAERKNLQSVTVKDFQAAEKYIRIEGEAAARKSSPMLAPRADTAGPGVFPYSARNIRMNYIGGNSWSEAGAWIEWDFEVPRDGLYNIALNVRQHFHRGANSFRRITINGEVPFAEMESVAFGFANGWRVEMLGANENDDPFLFFLREGKNTIRMEAVLGDYAPHVREIQESVLILNDLYRQIVMITGVSPETARDYGIGRRLPHLRDALYAERVRLDRVFAELSAESVGRGERNTMIRSLSRLLTLLYSDVERIPQRLSHFRENTGALGTWLILVREQMLGVDAIYILPTDAPTPDNGYRWWRQVLHEILTLLFSYFIDFNTLGDVTDDGQARHVEVWIGTGRDQANIVKRMIDDIFTPNEGIGVTLMLVDVGTLLPATVAGQGPDVVLSVGNVTPMDFGMRGALRNLAEFSDFREVTRRFPEAAMVPYTFEGKSFALPETITFPMLFYRRDILKEIGLTPPDTWDDVSIAIEHLAIHHMEFGIPVGDSPMGSFAIFLYQNGGEFYSPDGSRSALNSDVALSAFRKFTRFYTEYNLARQFDFANRFRLGEMPLAIADYSAYNMLQVFAPEIRGLWGFMPVPATVRADGTKNRDVPAGGSGVIMMDTVKDADAAWEFMKWWTSAETQTQFGREMESLMGAAARHPTANLEAFGRMPWPVQDYQSLLAQFEHVRGIPEVPGGYFTPRQIRNAFFTTVELGRISPRDAMTDAVRRINDELRAKRREFGIEDRIFSEEEKIIDDEKIFSREENEIENDNFFSRDEIKIAEEIKQPSRLANVICANLHAAAKALRPPM
jgi:ABC-type glycerol-3-phosphate transport system substrate-binding protein